MNAFCGDDDSDDDDVDYLVINGIASADDDADD